MKTNQILAIIIALVTGGYLLPFAIGLWRGNGNVVTVFWVNLLLGWTIIGWLVALYLSFR